MAARSSVERGATGGRLRISAGSRVLRIHEHGAIELEDGHVVLVEAASVDPHDALARARAGLPDLQYLGFGVDGIAGEDRRRQRDILPAQVGDGVPANTARRFLAKPASVRDISTGFSSP